MYSRGDWRFVYVPHVVEFTAGIVANKLHKYGTAFHHFFGIRKKLRASASFWFWVADTLWELGKHDYALSCIDRAIELFEPKWKYLGWSHRALILESLGNLREAIKSTSIAVRLAKRHKWDKLTQAELYRDKADLLLKIGQRKQARVAIAQAVKLAPRSAYIRKVEIAIR